jgi:hypothetical protein
MTAQRSFEDQAMETCYGRLDSAGDPLLFLERHICWDGLSALMSGIRFDRRYVQKLCIVRIIKRRPCAGDSYHYFS